MRLHQWAILAALTFCQSPAIAHEAWIDPARYQVSPGASLSGHIRVGQLLKGNGQVFNPERFRRLDLIDSSGTRPVRGRLGDFPAIRVKLQNEGLVTLVYQSAGSRIRYDEPGKFENFANKEGVAWVLAAQQQRGQDLEGFSETFYRHAKSLIAVGAGEGQDRSLGLRFELVLHDNPYLGADSIRVQALSLTGKVRPQKKSLPFIRMASRVIS